MHAPSTTLRVARLGSGAGLQARALRYALATLLFRAGRWLQHSARRMDAWLAARAKSHADAHALDAMSERELRDIGLDPSRNPPAQWAKDWSI